MFYCPLAEIHTMLWYASVTNVASSSLSFQVISAQQLPKPEHDKPTSIVDPQVWVEVHGVPIDINKKKTHHVNNNGERLLLTHPSSNIE